MDGVTYGVGIDVGGTFTDLFVWPRPGEVESLKVLTTPRDPSLGVLEGLRLLAEARGMTLPAFAGRIRTIVHGTTVTTNAVLTRRGARTGLLTTRGVRDALEMRRGIREAPYDNHLRNVTPLVPRRLRLTARGRLDRAGAELERIDLDEVREAARRFRQEGLEAVAVCFLHAYADPAHERAAAEVLRAELPDAFLSVSADVLPTIRFYDRTSTTVLNAYTGPVLGRYLRSLTGRLDEIGFSGVLLIMQSSGGVALPEVTMERPATTLLSGPAAGPRAGLAFAEANGWRSCLVVDMGGTSFDASLVRDGRVELKAAGDIERLRVALPMLDIVTIGAGGGSIGWIDAGGLLRVGPESAGAEPGPACYGRNGERPTVTDADLVLGYLDPAFFAGGRLRLAPEAARRAIETHVARPLRLEVDEAAAGMYRVVNANMAHGVRMITVQRGLDPREFPMVVAGGAGAVHACMIASELEIPTLVVPYAASILCATGMLLSDLQHDFVRSCVGPLEELDPARLAALVGELAAAGEEQLRRERVAPERIAHEVALDLRYLKQYHEVTLQVPREAVLRGDVAAIAAAFHREHDRLFGYDLAAEGTGLELINVRVRSIGRTDKPGLPMLSEAGPDPARARKGIRRAFVPEARRFAELPVYDGHRLGAGNVIPGPSLIDRTDTTIFVSAAYTARVDRHGSLVVRRTA
jgi:N-methylhydantoinase A